jgi:anti-sigma factor RsiW
MSHVLDDLELHAVGALPAERASAVALHIESCASCRAAAEDIAEVVALLADAVPPREPPADLRDRVLAAARADVDRAPRPSILGWLRPRIGTLAMAAVIALLVGVDASQTVQLKDTQDDYARYAADLRRASRADRSWYMAGVEQWAGMGGSLVVPSTDRRPFVLFHDLRMLPADQLYAVWLIAPDGRWVRGTSFRPDGQEFQLIEVGMTLSGYEHCAVTVEASASGKRQGPVVMRSRIEPAAQ